MLIVSSTPSTANKTLIGIILIVGLQYRGCSRHDGPSVEVSEWIKNFTPHYVEHVITHPWLDSSSSIFVKGSLMAIFMVYWADVGFICWPHMGLLPDTQNCGLCMHRKCRVRYPHHWLQRKQLVSDLGMHHGTRVTHVTHQDIWTGNLTWESCWPTVADSLSSMAVCILLLMRKSHASTRKFQIWWRLHKAPLLRYPDQQIKYRIS